MGLGDRIRNSARKIRGGGKPTIGRTTGDGNPGAGGRGEQSKADLRHVGEKIKDAFRKH